MAVEAEFRFDPNREQAELAEYLGGCFEVERLWRWQEQLDAEVSAIDDEATFYRTSTGYLYNLTAFAMTGAKLPYLRELTRRVRSGARVLDYGCGVGSDGLMLMEGGYRVEFADFINPSTEYLRWRLARRGLSAPIHDLDRGVPAGFDAVYAFDVIEHVQDPFSLLAELEKRGRLIEVNFLEPIEGDQERVHPLPIGALLKHAASRRLLAYKLLHGRSHLVLYEPEPSSSLSAMLSRTRIGGIRLQRQALSAVAARVPRRAGPRAKPP